jgi:hypothetical protein
MSFPVETPFLFAVVRIGQKDTFVDKKKQPLFHYTVYVSRVCDPNIL